MSRRLSVAGVAVLLLVIVAGLSFAQDAKPQEQQLKGPALLDGDTTLVPLRELGEWIGAVVEWAPPHITLSKGTLRVELTLGSSSAALTDGQRSRQLTLASPPRVIDDMTYVPLRFVAEAFGVSVDYREAKGVVALSMGDRTATLPVATETVDAKTSEAPPLDDALAYYKHGKAYLDKHDYDRAIADFDKAIPLEPGRAWVYNNRGVIYARKGDHDRAIADFSKAIALMPDNTAAGVYANRGLAYVRRRDYDRAIADFNKAIALKSDDADAYNIRGVAYVGKHAYDHAISDFSKAIALTPDAAAAYNNRGNAYADGKHDYDRAIADFNRAIALEPDFAGAYNNRAEAWHGKKDYDKAWADVKRCREHGGTPNPAFVRDLREASGRDE